MSSRHVTKLTKDIVTQAERFVAARTTQLADLNARLAELGPAPTTGGGTEDPDVTRQRAALEKERNALDADVRLARVMSVDAQQRRAKCWHSGVRCSKRNCSSAPIRRCVPPSGTTSARNGKPIRRTCAALADELESGVATTLHDEGPAELLFGALGALALMAIGLTLTERSLAGLVARTFPVGRLRRSLLALLTVLAYILVVGLALSWAWETLESDGSWGTQSTRLAESAVRVGTLLAFVLGLGRALLANGRSSWRLPPMDDDMARRLAPLPWLFAFVALMFGLPDVFNEVLETPLNAVVSYIAPVVAFAVACVIGLHLLRRPSRAQRSEGAAAGAAAAPDRAADRPIWLGLLLSVVVVLMCIVLLLLATGYLALARTIAAQATWAGIVLASAYLLFKFADDLCMALLSSRGSFSQRLQKGLGRGAADAGPGCRAALGRDPDHALLRHGDRLRRAAGQQPDAVVPAQRQVRCAASRWASSSWRRAPSSVAWRCWWWASSCCACSSAG